MKRNLFTSVCLSMVSVCAFAGSPALVITGVNGVQTPIELDTNVTLTLNPEALQISDGAVTRDVDYASIQMIELAENGDWSGIDRSLAEPTELKVAWDGRTATATIAASAAVNVAVYNLEGKKLRYQSNFNESHLDLSTLPAGVYILTVNSQSFKIVKL
jgi:hypothetical protein